MRNITETLLRETLKLLLSGAVSLIFITIIMYTNTLLASQQRRRYHKKY